MAKIRGIFKGIKCISHFFAVKEIDRERKMEIGYPTDVKHVAHIGWDDRESHSAPSWLGDFKTSSDFSSGSLSNLAQSADNSWASQDFDQLRTRGVVLQPSSTVFEDQQRPDIPKAPKKSKWKKKKKKTSSSPPSSGRSITTKKSIKSKASFVLGRKQADETDSQQYHIL